jgi:hypothetical protein
LNKNIKRAWRERQYVFIELHQKLIPVKVRISADEIEGRNVKNGKIGGKRNPEEIYRE